MMNSIIALWNRVKACLEEKRIEAVRARWRKRYYDEKEAWIAAAIAEKNRKEANEYSK